MLLLLLLSTGVLLPLVPASYQFVEFVDWPTEEDIRSLQVEGISLRHVFRDSPFISVAVDETKVSVSSIESLNSRVSGIHDVARFRIESETTSAMAAIRAPEAWAGGATGDGIKVAIIDTGIDITHPEFSGRIMHCENFVVGDTSTCIDENDHGTHVAGLVAARLNNVGVAGSAHSADLCIMKACNGFGNCYADSIARAAEEARRIAHVVSMSFGGNLPLGAAFEAAVSAGVAEGVMWVAAAGNSGKLQYPAKYEFVLAVSACNDNGWPATWTAPGQICAPGVNVRSTLPGGNYGQMSGTSMATPIVSGAIAAVAQRMGISAQESADQLLLNTHPDSENSKSGSGFLNMYIENDDEWDSCGSTGAFRIAVWIFAAILLLV